MTLKALSLKNFRNISNTTLEFHPRFNIFVGSNAQGKTNILEAIYFLAFGRSFRLSDYTGLIQWGQKEGSVRSWLSGPLGEEERSVHLTEEKKRVQKNGKNVPPNQFNSMPTVLFAPEEILLLKDSPQARRDYMDGLLSKLSPTYGGHLRNFKRALAQRNRLLKEESLSNDAKLKQMILWEVPLIEHGRPLITERKQWGDKLNKMLSKHYSLISGDNKTAHFSYTPNVEEELFPKEQERRREEELERGVSLVGPHRDDFLAHLDLKIIRSYGSQGEMRTFTLALKLSEIELFEEGLKRSPFLLLDDVVSELDEKRCRFLFEYLKNFKGQVFATSTSLALFPPLKGGDFKGWEVKNGFTF